jgi:hypothetical protein
VLKTTQCFFAHFGGTQELQIHQSWQFHKFSKDFVDMDFDSLIALCALWSIGIAALIGFIMFWFPAS